jgi:hypothetical protein
MSEEGGACRVLTDSACRQLHACQGLLKLPAPAAGNCGCMPAVATTPTSEGPALRPPPCRAAHQAAKSHPMLACRMFSSCVARLAMVESLSSSVCSSSASCRGGGRRGAGHEGSRRARGRLSLHCSPQQGNRSGAPGRRPGRRRRAVALSASPGPRAAAHPRRAARQAAGPARGLPFAQGGRTMTKAV